MGSIRKELAAAILVMTRDDRFEIETQFQAERPYEHNLNILARYAADHDFDYWMTFDDDQCPTANPLDIIDLDLDVVSCPAPIWMPDKSPDCPVVWNGFDDLGGSSFRVHRPTVGLQEVGITGSGALLIARRVFTVLERPFLIDWDSAGRKVAGPDIAFCRRAREAGFKIWCHYDYPCRHYVVTDIAEVGTWIAKRFAKERANAVEAQIV
jgi:hypothetical protein